MDDLLVCEACDYTHRKSLCIDLLYNPRRMYAAEDLKIRSSCLLGFSAGIRIQHFVLVVGI